MAKEVTVDRAAETRLRALIGAAGMVAVLGANIASTDGYIGNFPTLSQRWWLSAANWRTSRCCSASCDLRKAPPIGGRNHG